MAFQVRYSRAAYADIEAALAWRAKQSLRAAEKWHCGFLTKIDTLGEAPERCPLADEAADLGIELRELLYGKRRNVFRILFVIEGATVQVVRIRHGAQDRLRSTDLE